MKKDLFSTKTIVATGLGTALFLVLFMFVKIEIVPNTNLQLAYAISSFFGVVFGPICGGLVAFAGHALNDFLAYGSCWWSWIIASGVAGVIAGIPFFKSQIEEGKAPKLNYFIWNVVAHAVAWLVVAPGLDVLIYGEDFKLVWLQGAVAFLVNAASSCIVGYILALAYSKTKVAKGSLDKE